MNKLVVMFLLVFGVMTFAENLKVFKVEGPEASYNSIGHL